MFFEHQIDYVECQPEQAQYLAELDFKQATLHA